MSQTATLAFLAVWHGWHAGYYITFFNEFIVISFEKDFSTVWNKSVRVARYQSFKMKIWICFFISIFQMEGASCLHHCHNHHWLVIDSILLFSVHIYGLLLTGVMCSSSYRIVSWPSHFLGGIASGQFIRSIDNFILVCKGWPVNDQPL